MQSRRLSRACAALAMVTAVLAPRVVGAQQRVLLPEGTVLTVTTDQRLDSASMRQGATFTTTVEDSINVEGHTVIPAGSRRAHHGPLRAPR